MATEHHTRSDYRYAPIPEALLFDPGVTATAKVVYGILARHGMDPASCYPSHRRIGSLAGIAARSVARPLRELEDAGWVSREPRHDERGQRVSDGYHLHTIAHQNAGTPHENVGGPRSDARGHPAPARDERKQDEREPLNEEDAPITLADVMRAEPCCHLHQVVGCCDPDDCGPCCERCPTCPTLQRQAVEKARPTFEVFWAAYPRKVGKRAAEAAWGRASRRADPWAIVAGAERYAADPNREDGFTAHPTTWLNADRWDDPPLPARSSGRGPTRMQRTLANLGGALADEGGDHGQGGNGTGAGQARRGLPAGG